MVLAGGRTACTVWQPNGLCMGIRRTNVLDTALINGAATQLEFRRCFVDFDIAPDFVHHEQAVRWCGGWHSLAECNPGPHRTSGPDGA